jgi:2-amino-4-hydroxy-6-hydroxymethyldihydropteridine diphosphokinase
LDAALRALASPDCHVPRRSSWYRSAPLPRSDQPWFVNGVAEVATDLSPPDLLARLHAIERDFGRVRTEPNAARVLDLDLLLYHDLVWDPPHAVVVPHPRMTERAFVLLPLRELVPGWVDPRSGRHIDSLIGNLPSPRECQRIESFDS